MKKNPVEAHLDQKKEAAAKRRADELQHLELWKSTGDDTHLQPLINAYEPVIANATRKFRAPSVPEESFRAEAVSLTVKAFGSYDPSRGTQLNTHVQNELRKLHRYNGKYNNAAYIPPEKARHIGHIDRAREHLQGELGRTPTNAEIASKLQLSTKLVNTIEGGRRNDIPTSVFEEDPFESGSARHQEVLSMLPQVLSERAQTVFHHLYGDNKHQTPMSGSKPNLGALAKNLGLSPSQLSRSHGEIIEAYRKYK